MLRRIMSLLLLPYLLLTQSAVFGHAHSDGQPIEHDLRAHFHTQPTSASRSHRHEPRRHSAGEHHHHHDGEHHCHDGRDNASEPKPQPEPLSDHDSDAVFIPYVSVVIGERPRVEEELMALVVRDSLWFDPGAALWDHPPRVGAHWLHGPPLWGCVNPLYIHNVALLI